jgi:hypothetical protein
MKKLTDAREYAAKYLASPPDPQSKGRAAVLLVMPPAADWDPYDVNLRLLFGVDHIANHQM